MSYGLMLDRPTIEKRIRELHAAGYKVRDLASLFGIHPQVVERILARGPSL